MLFKMPFLKKKRRIFLPQIHYFTILKLLLYIFFLKQPYNHSWPLLNNYLQTWNKFKLLTNVKRSGVWNTCKRISLRHEGTQIAFIGSTIPRRDNFFASNYSHLLLFNILAKRTVPFFFEERASQTRTLGSMSTV